MNAFLFVTFIAGGVIGIFDAKHVDKCFNVAHTLQCPADSKIQINEARYGRPHSVGCGWPAGNKRLSPKNCLSDAAAKSVMMKRCDGKKKCWYHVCPALFGMSMPNCRVTKGGTTYNGFLHLDYECVKSTVATCWKPWSKWSRCSPPECGSQSRTRYLVDPGVALPCSGDREQTRKCGNCA